MPALRRALLAATLLAAVPFTGTASARCAPPTELVCVAYAAACGEIREVEPLDRYCTLYP